MVATVVLVKAEMVLEEQPANNNGIKARRGSNFRTALMVELRAVLGKPWEESGAPPANIRASDSPYHSLPHVSLSGQSNSKAIA